MMTSELERIRDQAFAAVDALDAGELRQSTPYAMNALQTDVSFESPLCHVPARDREMMVMIEAKRRFDALPA